MNFSLKKITSMLLMSAILLFPTAANAAADEPQNTDTEVKMIDLINDTEEGLYTNGSYTMPYRVYIPEDYDDSKSYPLLLFLHGAGERGSDNKAQLYRDVFQSWLPDTSTPLAQAIVVFPQCPTNEQWVDTPWAEGSYSVDEVRESKQAEAALDILYEVVDAYNVDENRIYVSGISMGGFGTWDLLMRHGEIFAAAIPICGGADPSQAELLTDIPIWTFHGSADSVVPVSGTREIYESIIEAGGEKIEYTEYEGMDHNVWTAAAAEPGIQEWLLSHKLSDRYPETETVQAEESEDEPLTEAIASATPKGMRKYLLPAIIGASALITAAAAMFIVSTVKKRNKHANSARAAAVEAASDTENKTNSDK